MRLARFYTHREHTARGKSLAHGNHEEGL